MKVAACTGAEEWTVVAGAAVVDVVDDVVDGGIVAGAGAAVVGAGALATGADELDDDACALRAVRVVPLHPVNANRGSAVETAVRSQ
jgi:X-X-X-Leu-X-X-Gly heptad repeat protein